jgi:hypothetical protein
MKYLLLLPALALSAPAFAADPVPMHAPSTCPAEMLESHITEEMAAQPDRVVKIVTGKELAVFAWNMKWAFDVDVEADTLYLIQASSSAVYLFTVKDHCITYFTATIGSLIAELLQPDAWEHEHPDVPGSPTDPMPAGRP